MFPKKGKSSSIEDSITDENEKREPDFKKINTAIFILNIVLPVPLFCWMLTNVISTDLLLFMWVCTLSLGAVYKIVMKKGKGYRILTAARCITAFSIILFYMPTVVILGFKETKPLYEAKRWVYLHGNFARPEETYGLLLPKKLPAVCDDYTFLTQGSFIAQDYHPSSLLIFHTDSATIEQYSEYYGSIENVQIKYGDEANRYKDYIIFQEDALQSDLSGAELFYYKAYYPMIVILDRSTGLVAVYT